MRNAVFAPLTACVRRTGLIVFAAFFLLPAGFGQKATVSPSGGVTVSHAGVPVLAGDSLILADANWKAVDSVTRGPAKITRRGDVTEVRYESALTKLLKTVTNRPDGAEVRWEFEMKSDPRGRNVELCVAIPAAVLADFRPGKTKDAQTSREELRVSSFLGEFTFDVRGSTAPWSLDDLRTVEWSKAFRLRFAPAYDPAKGLRATAVLRVKAAPSRSPAFVCLDIAAAGNRGLRDEVPDDGKGGWTDQGDNDLRAFAPGRRTFFGVPLVTGERVVVLRGTPRPGFPAESACMDAGDRKLSRFYLFHTAAWGAEFRQPVAEYVVTYADAQTAREPVRYGVEVNDWWGALEPLEARLAWCGDNGKSPVGLYLARWNNPRPDAPIRSLQMRSLDTASVPILLAATGIAAGALAPEQMALLDAAFADRANPVVSTQGWIPAPIAWCDGIEPGSALDVSFLNDAPAGKHGFLRVRDGRFVFEKGDGKPVRFWGTNVALHGPFPPKEDAPGIARAWARQGVNMARLHLYAVYEDTMIAPDGSLNAVALDRFEFFIAQMKANGIYVYLDLNDGMFYDRLAGRKLPAGNDKLKFASLFNRELIEAQKRLARQLFTHVNPYTGLRMCDDSAVALYEITNENSMTMGWGSLKDRLPGPYYTELRGLWCDWLKANGLPDRELPESLGERGDPDSRRFAAEQQRRYLEEMRDFLRALGVQAPICGTNITFTLGDLWASEGMDYTNDHAYWDHPNVHARPITYGNRPALRGEAWRWPMLPSFARARLRGKPVVAGEWNYCFPNDYRCEGLPIMAAYGAYQDWNGLLFFCADGSFDGGRWARFHDWAGILVHTQQTDPATWGLSQVAALLYRRGDVRVGQRTVTLRYDKANVWADRSVLGSASFLPAIARIETTLSDQPVRDWPITMLPESGPAPKAEELYAESLRALGDKDSTETRTVTDTGELVRDAADGILTVDTPRTQIAGGFLSRRDEVNLSNLSVRCETRFATIALASLDGQPIAQSRRLLLTAVANARNADTKCEARRIENMGKGPVLAEPVTAHLALRADAPQEVRVHALDTLTGKRTRAVAAEVRDKSLTFRIGPDHKTVYYELQRD